jgi:hypothetical protein
MRAIMMGSSRLGSSVVVLALLLLAPSRARAEAGFAVPPERALAAESRYDAERENDGEAPPFESAQLTQPSSLRVGVGPALRVAEPEANGGLYVALDIGARAAGVRASAAWTRAGAEHGVSQYTAELWIDFGVGRELHPIIGAGAGVARVEDKDAAGDDVTSTLGFGVLRGTLEYVLPVAGVDARVGLDAIGCVPATPGGESDQASPWLLGVGHVAVGF